MSKGRVHEVCRQTLPLETTVLDKIHIKIKLFHQIFVNTTRIPQWPKLSKISRVNVNSRAFNPRAFFKPKWLELYIFQSSEEGWAGEEGCGPHTRNLHRTAAPWDAKGRISVWGQRRPVTHKGREGKGSTFTHTPGLLYRYFVLGAPGHGRLLPGECLWHSPYLGGHSKASPVLYLRTPAGHEHSDLALSEANSLCETPQRPSATPPRKT